MDVKLAAGPARFNLVVYTFNFAHAWHALILAELPEDKLRLYSFYNSRTFELSKGNCLPFRTEDYQHMCEKGFWDGIIVYQAGTNGSIVKEGRMNPDAGGPGCELFFRNQDEPERAKPWMPLQHCRLIGHVDAQV